jgi:hypothetical protein
MALRAIAAALNARGVATARGGRWQAMTVRKCDGQKRLVGYQRMTSSRKHVPPPALPGAQPAPFCDKLATRPKSRVGPFKANGIDQALAPDILQMAI